MIEQYLFIRAIHNWGILAFERIILPDKPGSINQRYHLTGKGHKILVYSKEII